MKKCGLCIEFGPTGMRQTKFNNRLTNKCDVSCKNGNPVCAFHPKDALKGALGVPKGDSRINIRVCFRRWCLTVNRR